MRRVVLAGVLLVLAGCGSQPRAAGPAPPPTERVERGRLSAEVSGTGTLTYAARPDGSPYTVTGQAEGVYTALPRPGDAVGCGDVLYRVDNRPVLLLCGAMPAYRALQEGASGPDVRQLNRTLLLPGATFTARTASALAALQRRRGATPTGRLALGAAVFLPGRVRIARVTAEPGAPARPGAPVLTATSDRLHIRVELDASQQDQVERGDRVRVTLPGNRSAAGRVTGFGRIAQAPQGAPAAAATVPTFIALAHPGKAAGLDQAPVDVDITVRGVDDALSVPVTALVGKAGGGFAVEVVRGTDRALVPVRLGLFDTGGGRVQVEGALKAGDAVVVPSL